LVINLSVVDVVTELEVDTCPKDRTTNKLQATTIKERFISYFFEGQKYFVNFLVILD
jgi:hypothetical protein